MAENRVGIILYGLTDDIEEILRDISIRFDNRIFVNRDIHFDEDYDLLKNNFTRYPGNVFDPPNLETKIELPVDETKNELHVDETKNELHVEEEVEVEFIG